MEEKRASNLKLFKTSCRRSLEFLNMRTRYMSVYLAMAIALLVLRAHISVSEMRIKALISEYKDNYESILVIFMITRFWRQCIEYIYSLMFQLLITPVGGLISASILNRMLSSENREIGYQMQPQQTEYIITEGSKAMAKMGKYLFVTILNILANIIGDFYYVFTVDNTPYKSASILFIVLASAIAFSMLLHLRKASVLVRQTSQANLEKRKYYVETASLIPIIQAYNEEDKFIEKCRSNATNWETIRTESKLLTYTNRLIFKISCELLTILGTVLYISLLDSQNPSKTGMDANIDKTRAFNSVLMRISRCFISIIRIYKDLIESIMLSQRLILLLKYVEEDLSQKIRIDAFNDNITVQGLTYAIDDKVILSNIALTINKGDRCAMVGRNGTGKSSIFKLLLGFDDYKGSITLDGIDIQRICMSDYRSLISYVPQDTKLFDESIYYNLAFGNNRPYKDIMEECKKMKIHEIIMRFPQGYNTVIEGGGKNINGGLRQKIFYTRAFLCNTEIYLFDEPTNNLDETSTSFILEYMSDARFSDKTFFVICHDPEIVEKFPKVFKLNERQIELERELC